jgi:outer membrane protein insertion porin family
MGERIDVEILTGTRSSNFLFSFTQPYFLDTKASLGLSVFKSRFRFDTFTAFFGMISPDQNIPLYTQKNTGFTVTSSYPLGRWTRVGMRYSLQDIGIHDIADIFEDFALNQLVGFTPGGSVDDARKGIIRSEVAPTYSFNTKTAFFNATGGSQLIVEVPVAGGPFGGSFNIIRPFVEFQNFRPDSVLSGGRNTLAMRIRLQHIIPFGQLPSGEPMSPPFFERFFSGGEFTLRGFDIRSVSPWSIIRTPQLDVLGNPIIDPVTGLPRISEQLIPIGGDTSIILTGEYRVPIAGPFQVVGFADFGTSTIWRKSNLIVFGPNAQVGLLNDTNNVWRLSTGGEIQFTMPVVHQPFRLIFAYNPLKLDTDVVFQGIRFPLREPSSNVRFSVGYNF